MSPEEARFCLQEAEGHLSAAIQELIQMEPALGWQQRIEKASESLLRMKGVFVQESGELTELLVRVRARAERAQELLDSAASFLYGCMSSACSPSMEYTVGGEMSDQRCSGVLQTLG